MDMIHISEKDKELHEELATRMCAAYVSYSMGYTGVDRTLKGYRERPAPIGDLWYFLAKVATMSMMEGLTQSLLGNKDE